jgi:hypothetical protein
VHAHFGTRHGVYVAHSVLESLLAFTTTPTHRKVTLGKAHLGPAILTDNESAIMWKQLEDVGGATAAAAWTTERKETRKGTRNELPRQESWQERCKQRSFWSSIHSVVCALKEPRSAPVPNLCSAKHRNNQVIHVHEQQPRSIISLSTPSPTAAKTSPLPPSAHHHLSPVCASNKPAHQQRRKPRLLTSALAHSPPP